MSIKEWILQYDNYICICTRTHLLRSIAYYEITKWLKWWILYTQLAIPLGHTVNYLEAEGTQMTSVTGSVT